MIKQTLFFISIFLVSCSTDSIKMDKSYIKNELNRGLNLNDLEWRFILKNESGWDQVVFLEPYSSFKDVVSKIDVSKTSLEQIRNDLGEYESGHVYFIKDKKIIGRYFGHRFLVKEDSILVVKSKIKEVNVRLRDGTLELSQ